MQDLRQFLASYESQYPDDVLRVARSVSLDFETTAYVLELERTDRSPLVIFENLEGYAGLLVQNVFGSRERIARILGTKIDQLHETWTERTEKLIQPVWVDEGPVHDIVATSGFDVQTFPIPKHFLDDAGRYVTSGVCVARDPDTGVMNLAFARMQVKGPDKLGISVHSRGHLWDYLRRSEEAGKDLELAVVLGAHPFVMLASGSRAPMEVDEYEIAGALAEEAVELVQCKTIDVGVPASAEIVFEGRILAGAREDEGPFGEYAGYSTSRSTRNVVRLSAVTHRRDPVYFNVTPGLSSEHLLLDRVQKESTLLAKLRNVISDVVAVYYPKSGTLFHCYVSIDKKLEGQPQQVGALVIGLDQYVKLVIVVDKDIDVTREEEVLWALATRFQADRDLNVIRRGLTNVLDPSSTDGMSAKMILDATAPLKWDATPLRIPPDVVERVRKELGPAGNTRS
jgi:UbiD family decarboxylase